MKAKKYQNGGRPPVDPKKPLRLDESAKNAVRAGASKKFESELRRQSALREADMKRPIEPSYPELVLISANQAIKGAKTAATLKKAASFSPKKAASLFAADLALDAAADYDREKRKKK
jgi:hypothetical protein